MHRLGIDTGGTFSDFVLLDDSGRIIRRAKVPSTPSAPAHAVEEGLARLGGPTSVTAERVVVGTTVATNAMLERRGPRILFVTNEGFTDVPFIGRMDKERLYDLHWRKPKPLVHRRDCVGIGGRLAHDGSELEPVTEGTLATLAEWLRTAAQEGSEIAVAVCLLFSYVDGRHEEAVKAAIASALPDVPISVSHQVSPLWREYERASTTIADAFVNPVVTDYVAGVGSVMEQAGGSQRWNLLGSNGGYLSAEAARSRPAQLLLSGLAGGAIGAAYYARAAGHDAVFSLDMGGTSCDIGLILDGVQQYATEFSLAFGVPVSLPSVAVQTVGAGGGSIAWIDRGGLLHVGPRSAGAQPGPAAYGQGATEATVTDADLVLGRLDPGYFLGGTVPLHRELSLEAVSRVGAGIGLGTSEAALAITGTADENVANSIRLLAVERGLDPRDLGMLAFGGAGPAHARAIADRLEIATILVPPHPGLCSAFGAAIADARVDRVRTVSVRSGSVDLHRLGSVERQLRAHAVGDLHAGIGPAETSVLRSASLRYVGQNYELEVPIGDRELDEGGWDELLSDFEAAHLRQYGFSLPGEPVELIHLRATAFVPEPPSRPQAPRPMSHPEATRRVWFSEEPIDECPVLIRESLAPGSILPGPAVIQEPDSTTLVWPGDELRVLSSGILEITIGSRQ